MLKVKFKSNENCVKEEKVDTGNVKAPLFKIFQICNQNLSEGKFIDTKEENGCDRKKKGEIPEKVTLTKNFTLLDISQHWVHKGYNV